MNSQESQINRLMSLGLSREKAQRRITRIENQQAIEFLIYQYHGSPTDRREYIDADSELAWLGMQTR